MLVLVSRVKRIFDDLSRRFKWNIINPSLNSIYPNTQIYPIRHSSLWFGKLKSYFIRVDVILLCNSVGFVRLSFQKHRLEPGIDELSQPLLDGTRRILKCNFIRFLSSHQLYIANLIQQQNYHARYSIKIHFTDTRTFAADKKGVSPNILRAPIITTSLRNYGPWQLGKYRNYLHLESEHFTQQYYSIESSFSPFLFLSLSLVTTSSQRAATI